MTTCLTLLLLLGMVQQDDLQDRLDQKLKSAFLENADWTTDFDKAKEKAADSGKVIFAYFTRSYAP